MVFAIIALVSCGKADNEPDKKTQTCTLNSTTIVGVYKLTKATAVTIALGQSTEINVTSDIDAYNLDDLYEFKANGDFVWVDAGVRAPASLGTASDKWTLTGTKLTAVIQDYLPNPWYYNELEDFTVASFACDSMMLQKKVSQTLNNVNVESGIRYYLKRQ